MPRAAPSRSRSSSGSRRHKREQPKSYVLPADSARDTAGVIKVENSGRKHRRVERKRRRTPEKKLLDILLNDNSAIDNGLDHLDNITDRDLEEIEKQVAETRKRSVTDPKAEEERLIRQKWAAEKRIKEELARRFEIYLQKEVQSLLAEREENVKTLVAEKVSVERERIEKERKEAEEIRKEMERKERIRKMEEEMRQREELERLAEVRQRRLEEAKAREEEEKSRRLSEQLQQLEERQRREAAELKKKKREQEIVLNKNRSRARLCFTFNK